MTPQFYAESIVQTVREPLLVLDADLRVKTANRAFYAVFKANPENTVGRLLYELASGAWNIPSLRKLLEEILPNDGQFEEFALDREFGLAGYRSLVLNARRLHDDDNRTHLILLAMEDVTARKRAEADVAQQRAWLSVTLSSIGDAVIATDTDARISFMNPTAENLTGWTREQAAGTPLAEVFRIVNEETRNQVESPVTKAIRQGQIVGLANHTILIDKAERERHIDDSAAPIRDERGAIIGVVLVFRDTGERREAEKKIEVSEARYRRLFEAAHDGILILDADSGKVIDVNRFLVDLLRQPRAYFIGKRLWELGMFQDIDASKATMMQLNSRGYVRYEDLPLSDSDGRQIPVEFVSNVYQEDGHAVIQCNIRDIRARKELERDRAALLSQEHAARVEAQAAERANRAKDVFLATLSHEMRTPLNAILGWATILGGDDVTPADIKEGVAVIARSANAQARLIEDVLDVSRIVSDKLRLDIKSCDLRDLVGAAVDTIHTAADEKGIQVVTGFNPAPLHVNCDTARIEQVIWNILSNAIKFTPSGGKITVTLARERSNARLQITDTGAGIAPEFVPYVWDRFRQAEGGVSKRRFGGLGLGLSIVKHLVELHGGTVRAESEGEGKGSTFTVYLPIQAVRAADTVDPVSGTPQGESSAPTIKGLRIVIVDDDADSRRMLAKILTDAGALVSAAASAAEAVDSVTKARPDVLISDIGMPDVDGFDLIRRLRDSGFTAQDIPAIALTAFAHVDDDRRAVLAGFQVHIAKPVDPKHLISAIADVVKSSR